MANIYSWNNTLLTCLRSACVLIKGIFHHLHWNWSGKVRKNYEGVHLEKCLPLIQISILWPFYMTFFNCRTATLYGWQSARRQSRKHVRPNSTLKGEQPEGNCSILRQSPTILCNNKLTSAFWISLARTSWFKSIKLYWANCMVRTYIHCLHLTMPSRIHFFIIQAYSVYCWTSAEEVQPSTVIFCL